LTLDGEVLDSKVLFPIVGQALVKRAVLVSSDVLRVAGPERFRLVELFIFDGRLFDLLGLLGLILIIDFLDFGFVITLLLDLGFLDLVVLDFLDESSVVV
jgi:hypothetical protein